MTEKRTSVLDESNGPAQSHSDDRGSGAPEDGLTASPATAPADLRGVRRGVVQLLSWPPMAPTVAFVVLVLVIGLTHPAFFSEQSIVQNVRAAAFVAIIAVGMVFLLALGEIDISVGGIYGISFWVCAKLGNYGHVNMYIAAAIAILAGVGLGLVNGLLVKVFRAPAIIITLGTYSLYAGIVDVISGGLTIGQGLPLNDSFFTVVGGAWLGIPVAGWIALALTVALAVILNRSRLGAMIRAVGSNRSAAVFSGIPELRLRVYCLMLTGGLAALSGVLTLAFDGGGDSTVGTGMELQAIAAAIIGGTAITGGTGSVPGGLIGALLVATINSALVFFNVDALWDNVVTGAVILIAVGSGALLSQRRTERLARLH